MKHGWLLLAGGFWLVMNLLLWRSEYGAGVSGNPLPVEKVLSRILETPDPSELDIYLGNEKKGSCRWMVVQVGEEGMVAAEKDQEGDVDLEAAEMAGLIQDIHAYAISLDGQLQWEDQPRRIRFMIQLDLSSDRQWVSLDGKVGMAGTWVHIHARRGEETFAIELDEEDAQTARIEWSFDELRDPETALAKLTSLSGLPPLAVSMILGSVKSLPNMKVVDRPSDPSPEAGFAAWKAASDWLNVAHSRMRVYRMDGPYGEDLPFKVTINRAGEILLVELPRGLRFRNQGVLEL